MTLKVYIFAMLGPVVIIFTIFYFSSYIFLFQFSNICNYRVKTYLLTIYTKLSNYYLYVVSIICFKVICTFILR
jgi:hypothetical protein